MVSAPPRPQPGKVHQSDYQQIAASLDFPARREKLAVIYILPGGLTFTEWMGTAADSRVYFSIPRLIRHAKRFNAKSFALAHNHPSGNVEPSSEDVRVTEQVQKAAAESGLVLLDHLVVTDGQVDSIMSTKAGAVNGCSLCLGQVSDIGEHTREHYRAVHALAREIRRSSEKYSSALKRAWKQTKEGPHWDQDAPEPESKPAPSTVTDGTYFVQYLGRGVAPNVPGEHIKAGTMAEAKDIFARKHKITDRVGIRAEQISGRPVTPQIVPTKPRPAAIGIGNATTATGPDPSKVYEFRYRILPFEIVEPSHTDALDPNPRYPRELQPRLRDRAASRLQIRTMAQNLDAKALIIDFHTLDRGPMIVGRDEGQGYPVESGNGRTLALRLAQKDFPDKFREYQGLLRNSVEQYGIDPEDLSQIDNPVLVRERLTEVDRVAFTEEANASTAMSMSPLEVALTDAKKLSDETLATLEVGEDQTVDQALQSPRNNSLVSGFLDKLPANERAALVDQAGRLNQVGLQRLKAAIFAKVYPGDAGVRLTTAFIESLDPTLKNVEAAMFDSLPQMARAEGLIRSGQRVADLTIGQDLAEAVDKLAALKQQRIPAADYIRQTTLTDRDLTPTQEKMLLHLEQFGRSRKVLREFLRGYVEAVIASPHPQQGAMFMTAQETKGDIVSRLIESQTRKTSTGALFELIEARERAGLVADPGRRYPRWSRARAMV